METYKKETITKTIRFDKETHNAIEKIAKQTERDFSSQVRFMCREYLRMKENK